nr:MAG TPA: hypothetical protein [Caudoviricetes sp.]DAX96138.1 MAG TPA: hypothetical protein [Bacteriophage sp.]
MITNRAHIRPSSSPTYYAQSSDSLKLRGDSRLFISDQIRKSKIIVELSVLL